MAPWRPSIDYSFQQTLKYQRHQNSISGYWANSLRLCIRNLRKEPWVRKTDSKRQIKGLGRDTAAWLSVMKENKLSLIGVERVEKGPFSCSLSNPQLGFKKLCPDHRPACFPPCFQFSTFTFPGLKITDVESIISASFHICTCGTDIMWGLKGAVAIVMTKKAIKRVRTRAIEMKSSGAFVRTPPHGDAGGDLDEVFLQDEAIEEPDHTTQEQVTS